MRGMGLGRVKKRYVVFNVYSMQRHILTHNKPTYPNIPDVEKMGNLHKKWTLNQTLTAQCIVILKQSCDS